MDTPMQQERAASAPYEFTSQQNAVIGGLARDMLWLGAPLQLLGVLYAIAFGRALVHAFYEAHLSLETAFIGFAMAFFLAVGTWTSQAASSFKEIVTTQGQDVVHLMDALGSLQKLYSLVSIFVKLYVAIVLVTFLGVLIAGLVAAYQH